MHVPYHDALSSQHCSSSSGSLPLYLHFGSRSHNVSFLFFVTARTILTFFVLGIAIGSILKNCFLQDLLESGCSSSTTPIGHRTILIFGVCVLFSSLTDVRICFAGVGLLKAGSLEPSFSRSRPSFSLELSCHKPLQSDISNSTVSLSVGVQFLSC